MQVNFVKTNLRTHKISSHDQKFLSGYSNTCTVLQQTKQGWNVVCVEQKFLMLYSDCAMLLLIV